MPDKETLERARRDARQGKSASTQAGEFVREQIHHIREGKHGARSAKQAIAIGLSEARRAGVRLRPSRAASGETRRKTKRDLEQGRNRAKPSRSRTLARIRALRKEGSSAASTRSLSRQARAAAARRSPAEAARLPPGGPPGHGRDTPELRRVGALLMTRQFAAPCVNPFRKHHLLGEGRSTQHRGADPWSGDA